MQQNKTQLNEAQTEGSVVTAVMKREFQTHKLTWQVDVQGCKTLHATIWQKLITVAKGKAKIEMSSFFLIL